MAIPDDKSKPHGIALVGGCGTMVGSAAAIIIVILVGLVRAAMGSTSFSGEAFVVVSAIVIFLIGAIVAAYGHDATVVEEMGDRYTTEL